MILIQPVLIHCVLKVFKQYILITSGEFSKSSFIFLCRVFQVSKRGKIIEISIYFNYVLLGNHRHFNFIRTMFVNSNWTLIRLMFFLQLVI